MSILNATELQGIKCIGRVVAIGVANHCSGHIAPGQDGWTLHTAHGSRAAQFEHTVVVTRQGPLVVTAA